MMTDSDLKTLILDNLNSPFGYTSELLLTQLIERVPDIPPIPKYRIKNKTTDSFYTNLSSLKTDLGSLNIVKELFKTNKNPSGENLQPVTVIYEDIIVKLESKFIQDNNFSLIYGEGEFKLAFTMNYVNDTDPVLPLKIININLI